MKKAKLFKKLTAVLLTFVLCFTTVCVLTASTVVSAEETPNTVTWDFLNYDGSNCQLEKLQDFSMSMPGLSWSTVETYHKWKYEKGMGLMSWGSDGIFRVNVPTDASIEITYKGTTLPKITASHTAYSTPYYNVEYKAVENNGIYTITVDGIGVENSWVQIQLTNDAYQYKNVLRTFSYSAPNAVFWDFLDYDGSNCQLEKLQDFSMSMPGLSWSTVETYHKWKYEKGMGLMSWGADGAFISKVPAGASVALPYKGSQLPVISASSKRDGTFKTLQYNAEVNKDGIYTIRVDTIGVENNYVQVILPNDDYKYKYILRVFSYCAPEDVIWNFLDFDKYTTNSALADLGVPVEGRVADYGCTWACDNNTGLMAWGGDGVFISKVPADASIALTYQGSQLPVISVSNNANNGFTTLECDAVLDNGIYTITAEGIGVENKYVQVQLPNDSWSYQYKLRTFSYGKSKASVWNFTENTDYTPAASLNDLPFDMPGLVSNYGSQKWIAQSNSLGTVTAGVFIIKVPNDAAVTFTFAGALPTVAVGPTAGGPFSNVDVAPVLKDGIYTLTLDGIGIGNTYVQYTFPENGGWEDYLHSKLRTVKFEARSLIENPDADDLAELKNICLGIGKAGLPYDFHADEKIDLLDLVAMKKVMAKAS